MKRQALVKYSSTQKPQAAVASRAVAKADRQVSMN